MDGIPPWAVKGAPVVCIDNEGAPELELRGKYTIDQAFVWWDGPSVQLVEVEPDWAYYIGFRFSRFRPAISQSQDLAKFHHLLTPTPEERLDALLSDLNDQWEDEEVQAAMLARDAANGRCF